MRHIGIIAAILCGIAVAGPAAAQPYPQPVKPAIPAGRGYYPIPNVAEAADPAHSYKALFDSTKAAAKPADKLPVLERIGMVLNALASNRVPGDKADIAVIFHGPSVDALLRNELYRSKFGVDNPNLELIGQLQRAGVRFMVCGQYMAGTDTPIANLVDGVRIAEAATLVTIRLANAGYAVLPD